MKIADKSTLICTVLRFRCIIRQVVAGGVQQLIIMENVMEVLMKVMPPILVLIFVGTGFMYIDAMTDSFSCFCFRYIK